ncbi:transmembrane protein 70, mitochondrial isoform X1 [Larimichthys crocea]|uniref:transmembrane protein 70, mitochondrial isoform X1 n=1 Tax=Larimichthys crocea TaxID=215358 RepID=UPI00054B2303|nr:transmembrane protein 70, mitochondrial isoform X1 [Larimichthys crocea]
MYSVHILRRLRPFVASQAFTNIHAARHYVTFSVSCSGAVSGNQLTSRAFRRSLLNVDMVLSHCLSTHRVSTVTHSEDGNLIYTGNMDRVVRGIKLFSYSTTGASLFVMPYILMKTGLGLQSFAMQAAFCGFIGFFTFLTPILLHLITMGYVSRLYHNPDKDTYTAITYSFFLSEKRRVFHQKQVKIPAVSKVFTTFYADHMGLLVNPDLFPIPHDYNHLMGYDKPFRFDTDSTNRPKES